MFISPRILFLLASSLFLLACSGINGSSPKAVGRIFAIGGADFYPATNGQALPLIRYALKLTGKTKPKVCFLPTAAYDSDEYIAFYYKTMNKLACRPFHLIEKDLGPAMLDADVIFVGGGNTRHMLEVWKKTGVDRLLNTALHKGILLMGTSAGMICWFEQGSTDSIPGKLTPLAGLGFLSGSACPHYDTEKMRRPTYHDMILKGQLKEGIACDEAAAVLYENGQLKRVLSANGKARAYQVRMKEGRIIEEEIKEFE